MSSLLSADKLHTLRAVTGASLPDSKLRAALARAAGDLNLAASRLLTDLSAAAPLPVAAPPPPPPPPQQQLLQPPEASPTQAAREQQAALARAAQPPADVAHARRLAWRRFYCEQHARAVAETGGGKQLVDAFVVALWKQLGSKGRERYTNDVLHQVEEEARADQRPQQPGGSDEREHAAPLPVADEEQVKQQQSTDQQHAPTQSPGQAVHPPQAHSSPVNSDAALPSEVVAPPLIVKPPPPQPVKPQIRQQPSSDPQPPVAQSSTSIPSPTKRPRAVEWPRKLVTRSGLAIMTTRGRNLLRAGDRLQLSVPPLRAKKAREKKLPPRLVRFSKHGRELGRLAPDLAHALAPGLQSGFVEGVGKVVWAPKKFGMFAEVLVEVSVFVRSDAFEGNEASVEAGLGDDGEGIDEKRVNVVSMILDLKLCDQPGEKKQPDREASVEGALNAEDPGAVDENAAETYYNTVDKINEQEASKYEPPRGLACTLREYQRIGVLWMTAKEKHGRRGRGLAPTLINPLWKKCAFADGGVFYMNTTTGCLSLDSPVESIGGPYGGILADEMGLGKTVQCIACILHDIEEERGASGRTEQKENDAQSMELDDDCANEKQSRYPPLQKNTTKNLKCEADHEIDADEGEYEHTPQASQDEPGAQATDFISHDEVNTQKVLDSNMDSDVLGNGAPNTRRRSLRSRVRKRKRALQECEEDEISCVEKDSDKEYEAADMCESSGDDWMEVKRKRSKSNSKRCRNGERVQSAASVLMSSASTKKASFGGTLIVCPTSLVTQWINQLNQHVIPNYLRVATHYGQGRGDARSISLLGADVVVTSYGTLAAECSEDTANGEEIGPRDGPLFQLQWRRIVMDEAHTIKSRTTKWAKASYKIKAERRWCVTGTVIHNHVNDVFSLLHFLDVKPWSSWAFWNRVIVSNLESSNIALQKTAMSLIRDIISSVTLRRKKNTRDSQGKCIVQLTKKTVSLVELTPSSQERDFYSAIHQRSKLQFDTYLAQDKVMHNYASVLELLLRLRQACDHPYLVFAAAPSKDSVVMKDRDKLFKQFMEAGSSAEYVEKVFKDVESGAMKTSQCPLCLDIIDDPVAPKECGHPACRVCMMESLKRANKCPVCRIPITRDSVATLPRENRFSVDLANRWRSSAKIDELLKDVRIRQELREESKGKGVGKTVIFSQFTSMLDLVGTALEREDFRWLRIDGSVPQAKRALILEKFEKESELSRNSSNILLVSLRAGGVGLNLVAASFAILLDIHWNPQVDAQAQDRIHRHGQTRDVLVKRYIIKDTVEEKLLQVQSRKQSIADGALEVATDEDRKQAKLSELKLLFSTS